MTEIRTCRKCHVAKPLTMFSPSQMICKFCQKLRLVAFEEKQQQRIAALKLERRWGSNIADVTEGPPVGALVSIFERLAEMGVKRNTPYNS
jgi:hypothetical protein